MGMKGPNGAQGQRLHTTKPVSDVTRRRDNAAHSPLAGTTLDVMLLALASKLERSNMPIQGQHEKGKQVGQRLKIEISFVRVRRSRSKCFIEFRWSAMTLLSLSRFPQMSSSTSTTQKLASATGLKYGLNLNKTKPKPGNALAAAKPNPMANSKLKSKLCVPACPAFFANTAPVALDVFGAANDEEEEVDEKTRSMDLVRLSQASAEARRKKKSEKEQAALLAQDANAFAYDEVHEDIQSQRKAKEEAVVEKKKDRAVPTPSSVHSRPLRHSPFLFHTASLHQRAARHRAVP
jgi:hypothetical protein